MATTNLGLEIVDDSDYMSPEPFNDNFEIIDAALEDYIIEQNVVNFTGASGYWIYRKWASGLLETWGHMVCQAKFTNTWGAVYYCNAVAWPDFPVPYYQQPIVTSFSAPSSAGNWKATNVYLRDPATPTKPGAFHAYRYDGARGENVDFSVDIHVVGIWKVFNS